MPPLPHPSPQPGGVGGGAGGGVQGVGDHKEDLRDASLAPAVFPHILPIYEAPPQ